jgi:citrate lyase subunit beta/citryl-CoA lyase
MAGSSRIRKIDSEISRSWLLVNALKPENFDRAHASMADEIVLDIEDAVDPTRKGEALENVIRWLSDGGDAWVRINDYTTEFWEQDCRALTEVKNLKGVMLAKTEAGQQVVDTFKLLNESKPVLALVESALGIEDAREIAEARGAFRLAFGSGDYRRDTGTSADEAAMSYPRSRLVVASRVGHLPGPIDGPTVGTSYPVLREKSEITVALGMTGKLCLDLDQTPIINEVISPTRSDVTWARDFMADFEARGRVIRDGSDLPRLGRAEKIDKLAIAFGVEPLPNGTGSNNVY